MRLRISFNAAVISTKALLVLCAVAVAAASARAAAQNPSVRQLGWLSGCWEQRDSEGVFREFWTRPEGGTILQTGRMTAGSKTLFHETIQITDSQDELSALVTINGRRRVDFHSRALAPGRISFSTRAPAPPERLTYERVSKDRLTVLIEKSKKEGKTVERFDLKRADCNEVLHGDEPDTGRLP